MSENKPVRVALASESGARVDQHFGYATRFHVYDIISVGNVRPVETRDTSSWCGNAEAQANASEPFEAAMGLLQDCNVVLAVRFGPCASNALQQNRIAYYEFDGEISQALESLSRMRSRAALR